MKGRIMKTFDIVIRTISIVMVWYFAALGAAEYTGELIWSPIDTDYQAFMAMVYFVIICIIWECNHIYRRRHKLV